MKKYINLGTLLVMTLLLAAGCSDLKNDIPTVQTASSHEGGDTAVASANFHGKFLAASDYNTANCQRCHGANLQGGTSNKTCFSAKCHDVGEIHTVESGIAVPDSSTFHGKLLTSLAAKYGSYSFTRCKSCHGSDLKGNGYDEKNCYKCHSTTYVHNSGITDPSSPDFHGKIISGSLKWSLTKCTQCHGTDYSGGKVGKSCNNCHTQPAGPEACNTCHGDFSDPSKISPPRALDGSTATTSRGVGAHAAHLNPKYSAPLTCNQCHKVPAKYSDAGHIDTLSARAELTWGNLSKVSTGGITPNPAYDFTNLTCSGTYCHGNMHDGNTSNAPKWTGGAIACGSCHGSGDDPTPGGPTGVHTVTFKAVGTCDVCHSNVTRDQVSGVYSFKHKSEHVNGIVNFSK